MMRQPRRHSLRNSITQAVRSVVEPLEGRQLMHAGHDHGDGLEVLRVDAGATAPYVDSLGNTWQADAGFNGGGTDNKAFTVTGTNDPKLFTSRRAGEFSYSQPVADGSYTLNLLFSDWVTTAGTRKFNVAAEGERILTNFDIAASGGSQKALIKSFNVNVTGGMLDLSFAKVVGNPVISAFELIPVSAPEPGVPAAPTSLTATASSNSRIALSWADNSSNETGFEIFRSTNGVDFTARAVVDANQKTFADESLTASTHYYYQVRAINGSGPSNLSNVADATTLATPAEPPVGAHLRVDAAGNSNFTDAGGNVWLKDAGFTGGYANTGTFAVGNTIDDALFATRRTGNFTYNTSVANGDYTLRLLFADYSAAGSRKFNVSAEGSQILTNFDIAAEAGKNALVKSFPVKITDGKLNLAFASVVGNAALSAFELAPAGPVTIPASPTDLIATPQAGKIVLNWNDRSTNEDGFQIERAVNGSAFAGVHASVGANGTTFTDTNLDPTKTYAYRVRAINSAGPSTAYTNTASAKPLGSEPTDTFTKIAWNTVKSGPIGRAEALHAVVDGKLYVFAGFSGNAGPVARADVYNPATNTWTQIADMPRRLTHAGTTVDGRNVYFAGGYIGTGTGYTQQFGTKEVWRYNVDTNSYSAVRDLPAALAGGGLVVVGRQLHYFGGNNSSRQDVAVHYSLNLDDPNANWVEKKPITTSRSHMGAVVHNGLIYAVGGQKGNDGGLTAQSVVEIYNPATNTWTAGKSMPKGVNHISSATLVMGGRILTFGGQTSHNSPISNVYAYDIAANTWTSLTALPTARFSGVAGEINGDLYFTGGSSQTTTWKGIVG